MSNEFRDVAYGSSDANRATVPSSDRPYDPSTIRPGTASVNLSGAQRVSVRSGGPSTEQQVDHNRQPGFTSNNLNSGASRVTVGGSGTEKTSDGFARASSNMTEGREGVASIRSMLGSPKSGSDVRPDHIVRVGGMETTVQAAVASGFLRRAADRSYHDVGAQEIAQEEYQREQHRAEVSTKEAPVSVLNDPAAEALVGAYVSSVPATQSQQVIGALIKGEEVSTEHLAAVATARGVEASQVAAEIETMKTAFHDQARDYVGDKVLEYARAHAMNELKDAARQQVNTGSMAGYQKIAQAHMLNLPAVDAQAIITSPDGIKLGAKFNKSTGEVTLEIPGVGRTSWGAAIRAGLIQPYFPVRRR